MDKKRHNAKVFTCPLCHNDLEIRVSKKSKPYCVCSDCGIQLFIRGKKGISRLQKTTGFNLQTSETHESKQIREKLARLRAELKEVEKKIEEDIWEEHPELRQEREDLLWEIGIYEACLEDPSL